MQNIKSLISVVEKTQRFFKKIGRKILRFQIHVEHKIFDVCGGKNYPGKLHV